MNKAKVEYKPASPEPRRRTKMDEELQDKSAYSDPSRPNANAGFSTPRTPRVMGIQQMPSLSRSVKSIKKSVTLGGTFTTPMPMPFRDDGLPDWDAPTLGSYVSFTLENGPLKGRVVVLKRRENGMYVIAEDDHSSKDAANRDKDKSKLEKEDDYIETAQDQIDHDLNEIQDAAETTEIQKSAAWQRKAGKNPRGGLNAAGRASARREGHNLKPPVKSGSSLSDIKRRYSFLSRMSGNPGPEHDENGKPTRLLLSLQVWGASSKADAKAKAAMLKRKIERMEAGSVGKAYSDFQAMASSGGGAGFLSGGGSRRRARRLMRDSDDNKGTVEDEIRHMKSVNFNVNKSQQKGETTMATNSSGRLDNQLVFSVRKASPGTEPAPVRRSRQNQDQVTLERLVRSMVRQELRKNWPPKPEGMSPEEAVAYHRAGLTLAMQRRLAGGEQGPEPISSDDVLAQMKTDKKNRAEDEKAQSQFRSTLPSQNGGWVTDATLDRQAMDRDDRGLPSREMARRAAARARDPRIRRAPRLSDPTNTDFSGAPARGANRFAMSMAKQVQRSQELEAFERSYQKFMKKAKKVK